MFIRSGRCIIGGGSKGDLGIKDSGKLISNIEQGISNIEGKKQFGNEETVLTGFFLYFLS
jgi:hypothetical protein